MAPRLEDTQLDFSRPNDRMDFRSIVNVLEQGYNVVWYIHNARMMVAEEALTAIRPYLRERGLPTIWPPRSHALITSILPVRFVMQAGCDRPEFIRLTPEHRAIIILGDEMVGQDYCLVDYWREAAYASAAALLSPPDTDQNESNE